MQTQVIAEAGVNHNGDLALAKRLAEFAKDAGARWVKFQSFRTDALVTQTAPRASYQKRPGESLSQREMLKQLELSANEQLELKQHCDEIGIEFLSTPFDTESLELLVTQCQVSRIKLGSGELTNGPLLLAAARTGKPIVLSTGMGTLEEVHEALGVLSFGYLTNRERPSLTAFRRAFDSVEGQRALQAKVTLLHCTTQYPTPMEDVNLRAMVTLREAFGVPCGFSDHTLGVQAAIAAVALGAVLIEKHFTLDRSMKGPDHLASLEPAELQQLVTAVKQTQLALGSGEKKPTRSDRCNLPVARRSLVAASAVSKGEKFTKENLTAKRPASGVSPMMFWEIEGTQSRKDYQPDEPIE